MQSSQTPPSAFKASLWKQGFSWTGVSAALRWRRRLVEVRGGCLRWATIATEADEELEPAGTLDLRRTPCIVVGASGSSTSFRVEPMRGHRWKGLPEGQSARMFVFDACDSELSRDEWVHRIREHVRFGQERLQGMPRMELVPSKQLQWMAGQAGGPGRSGEGE